MAYASTVLAAPSIRIPSVTLPKFRWPHLSGRGRALLMMAILISPSFLSDQIGYCVMRLFNTADEIAARRAPEKILSHIRIFQVACTDPAGSSAQQERWTADAARYGWLSYPEAGTGCFKPDRNLLGVIGLKVFSVACPVMTLSGTDQRQWVAYTANRGWTAYPQAGEGCVDP